MLGERKNGRKVNGNSIPLPLIQVGKVRTQWVKLARIFICNPSDCLAVTRTVPWEVSCQLEYKALYGFINLKTPSEETICQKLNSFSLVEMKCKYAKFPRNLCLRTKEYGYG
ncbi:hypothetical protein AVEN_115898-1 [Araneus ventricosus]|uniref:Uncharacterized protein n=1 Tax=Araneus ventricosus TaxID=182803 RepID=A0A4Y2U2T1_ARAVE|nr:hypothetical protein AVEN_253554-1 [Araneus ventricosus]GBO05966.1 hypothetical protein AVEN_115898-1 [Araneus ventricosus]